MPVAASIAQRRDPKTGAFTVAGTATAQMLRKAWRIPPVAIKPRGGRASLPAPAAPAATGSPFVSFSALAGLRRDSVDTTNAVIRGVSVLTSGLIARGHGLAVDAVTLSQMKSAAETRGNVPVKIDHGSGAEAVCGYLTKFQIVGNKLKADWHLLKTHPRKDQILEVATVMPAGVGLSASFLPPPNCENGKARCAELLSVDYVTLPAANPDGLFSARVEDRATTRRKAAVSKIGKAIGAGALGAVGAASIAASTVDRVAALKVPRFTPSAKTRAGIIGAAAAVGGLKTAKAVIQGRRPPRYPDDPRAFAAGPQKTRDLTRTPHPAQDDRHAQTIVIKQERPSLKRRILTRSAKIAAGTVGGAYVGRKLGTAAGATTGALAGLLFQSNAAQNSVRAGLNFAARSKGITA